MGMLLGLLCVATNLTFWFFITAVEQFEYRHGWIPKQRAWTSEKPFPYLANWHTGSWGDLIGLSLIDFSVGLYLSTYPSLSFHEIALIIVIGSLATNVFRVHNLVPDHRPDSGIPKPGTFSWSGKVHLLYFLLQVSLGLYVFELILMHTLNGYALCIALIGGMIYVASAVADWYAGRFKPLQK